MRNTTLLLEYLSSATGYFYWDEQDTAVGWVDGPTIAFREELAFIFEKHETKGLPPLGATLILLSACRESWLESHTTLIKHITELGSIDRHIPSWIGDVLNLLNAVHSLEPALIASVPVKGDLVDYVFDDPNVQRSASSLVRPVVELLRSGETLPRRGFGSPRVDLWQTLGVLHDCLKKFDADAFRSRLKTGVERPLKEADAELPPGERVRALLRTLANDQELAGLARIARQLLAATSLPRPLWQSDELPLGGVTDISNRGNLDRLLVSELANDDLTMAVRVATNEALYLRREQPPRCPPFRRAILLDSGVRMWGVPRLIATAMGMAFSAAADRRLQIQAFRASGSAIVPIDLTRRDGVEAHLSVVEAEAHPGAALEALLQDLDQQDVDSEAVLITSTDALGDDSFHRALRSNDFVGWVTAVARDGAVQLLKATPRALLPFRSLRLDINDLLEEAPRPQPEIQIIREDHRDLPAYCRLERPPLRVPHSFNTQNAWHVHDRGVLVYTKDGRLLSWFQQGYGPKELAKDLPKGRLHWAEPPIHSGVSVAVIGSLSKRGLYVLQAVFGDEEEIRVFPLRLDYDEQPVRIAGDGAYIYVMSVHSVNVFSYDGEPVASAVIPCTLTPIRRQYFRGQSDRNIYILSSDGTHVHFATIHGSDVPFLLTVVQPVVGDDLIALFRNGEAVNLTTLEQKQVLPSKAGSITRVNGISRDDCFVEITTTNEKMPLRLDVRQGFTVPLSRVHSLEPEVQKFLPVQVNVRKHFGGICVNQNGQLALIKNSGTQLAIVPENGHLLLRQMNRIHHLADKLRVFGSASSPDNSGLQMANWSDGTRAWLDSRGLLHLQSSDSNLPEITLVLTDGGLSGWCSDGRIFGRPYLLGRGYQSYDITKIIDEVFLPIVRNLR